MAKEVTDRSAAAETVAAAAESHARRAGEAFKQRFAAFLPKGREMPDVEGMLLVLAGALRASSEDLGDKSRAHDVELADDAAPREARDDAAEKLVRSMVAIRATVETVYGRAGLRALGLDGRTPTDSKAIGDHARTFVKLATSPDLKLPKPQEGVAVDLGVWVKKVKKPLATLSEARKDVAREEREAQISGTAKTKAMDAFDDLFGVVATYTSATLELIGEDDLAARIRPSQRRRGATAGNDEAEEEGGGGGDDTENAGEAGAAGENASPK